MRNAPVAELAAAVADGQDIDWSATQARLTTPDDIRLVQALQTLSGLSAIQPALPLSAVRELPVLLRIARWIAIPFVVMGLVGLIGVLATRGVTGIGLIMLSLTVAFATAAIVVDIGSTDTRARALAALYWMLAASVSANGSGWLLLQWLGPAWFRTITGVRPEAFFAAALWAFAREFPSLTVLSAVDRVCAGGLRVALVVGSWLFVANVLPAIGLSSATNPWLGPFLRFRQGPSLYWLLLFTTAVPALVALIWRARLAVGQERQRARLFLIAIAACVCPLVIEVLLQFVFPRFGLLMNSPTGLTWGPAILYPPLLLLPVLTAFAVVKTDVLTLRVIVHRGLCYLLARWLLTWGTVVPFAALGWHLYSHADQPLANALAVWPGRWLVLASVVGIGGLSLRARLVRALDRWLLTAQEQPAEMLATMTERLKNARTPIEVIAEFSAGLVPLDHIREGPRGS